MSRHRRRRTISPETAELRIVGGRFRGRKLQYQGDPTTRPMKHRTREAIFNLISTDSIGRRAIDLFAGTGALGLEALSRGALWATFIEKHVPTARIIEANIAALDVAGRSELLTTSAFLWTKRDLAREAAEASHAPPIADRQTVARRKPASWLIFCSPPYSYFVERRDDMLGLIHDVMAGCPDDSVLIVESDERFDQDLLPVDRSDGIGRSAWDIRTYAPAVVGVWRKPRRE
ncbi:MAG: RsmD family RNA methyltransferase [Planctomycetota bacterium]